MIFTNNHGLPAPMVVALSDGWKSDPMRISVTALIGPPRIRTLTMKHFDEITEDVSGRLWALLGQGLHHVLSQYSAKVGTLALVEHPMKTTVKHKCGSIIISGRPDIYEDGVIGDYKITSVYSFLLGSKQEWVDQLNCYAFLFRLEGRPVKELKIHAILRDWQESNSFKDPDYPKIPFSTVPIELWDDTVCREYVEKRVEKHMSTPMAECTPGDRWSKPTTFAVMKVDGKRALRVLDSLDEADNWGKEYHEANPKAKLEIHERPGEDVRCARYCSVSKFCDQCSYTNPAIPDGEQKWEDLEI